MGSKTNLKVLNPLLTRDLIAFKLHERFTAVAFIAQKTSAQIKSSLREWSEAEEVTLEKKPVMHETSPNTDL